MDALAPHERYANFYTDFAFKKLFGTEANKECLIGQKEMWDMYAITSTAEAKGLAKGMEQGLAKGLEQGLAKGMEQGMVEGARQMIAAGFSADQVLAALGLCPEDLS